jgi:hypothetical protein
MDVCTPQKQCGSEPAREGVSVDERRSSRSTSKRRVVLAIHWVLFTSGISRLACTFETGSRPSRASPLPQWMCAHRRTNDLPPQWLCAHRRTNDLTPQWMCAHRRTNVGASLLAKASAWPSLEQAGPPRSGGQCWQFAGYFLQAGFPGSRSHPKPGRGLREQARSHKDHAEPVGAGLPAKASAWSTQSTPVIS